MTRMTKSEFIDHVVSTIALLDSFNANDFAAQGRAAGLSEPEYARAIWKATERVRAEHRIVFVADGDGSGTKHRATEPLRIARHAVRQNAAAKRKNLRAVDKMEVAIENSPVEQTASMQKRQARMVVQFQRDRPAMAELRREADAVVDRIRVAAAIEARAAVRVADGEAAEEIGEEERAPGKRRAT